MLLLAQNMYHWCLHRVLHCVNLLWWRDLCQPELVIPAIIGHIMPRITPSLAPDNSDNIGHWIPVWQLKETTDIDGEDWNKLDYNDQDLDINMDF